jgi:hypothetical protein
VHRVVLLLLLQVPDLGGGLIALPEVVLLDPCAVGGAVADQAQVQPVALVDQVVAALGSP